MSLDVGLLGHGRWGKRHLEALLGLKKSGKINRIFVCDTDEKQLRNLPPLVDAAYSTPEELFAIQSLDCVAIVTPPNTHLELASQAMKKNLPLFVEKPLSDRIDEVSPFLANIRANTTLITGFLLRHHSGIKMIQHLLSEQKIGALRELHYFRTTKRDKPEGAEAITTLAIHGFDLAILFGMNDMELANPHEFINRPAQMRFDTSGPRETRLFIDVSWNAVEEKRHLTLVGDKGELILAFGTTPKLTLISNTATSEIPLTNEATPLALEWEYVLKSISSGQPTVYPPIEDLLSLNSWLGVLRS